MTPPHDLPVAGRAGHATPDEAALRALAEEIQAECDALPDVVCSKCDGRGYHHGFGEGGLDPDWCEECGGAISWRPELSDLLLTKYADLRARLAAAEGDVRVHRECGEQLQGRWRRENDRATTAEQALATVTAERNKWHRHFQSLSQSISAEAAQHQRDRDEIAARLQLKGPPKGNQHAPHWWHSLVYRMEQRIKAVEQQRDTAQARVTALEGALRDVAEWLPALKPAGHDGDEESGQCYEGDEGCQFCVYQSIEARVEAALPAAPRADACPAGQAGACATCADQDACRRRGHGVTRCQDCGQEWTK